MTADPTMVAANGQTTTAHNPTATASKTASVTRAPRLDDPSTQFKHRQNSSQPQLRRAAAHRARPVLPRSVVRG